MFTLDGTVDSNDAWEYAKIAEWELNNGDGL